MDIIIPNKVLKYKREIKSQSNGRWAIKKFLSRGKNVLCYSSIENWKTCMWCRYSGTKVSVYCKFSWKILSILCGWLRQVAGKRIKCKLYIESLTLIFSIWTSNVIFSQFKKSNWILKLIIQILICVTNLTK